MEPPSQGIFRYFPLRKAHFFTPPLPFPTSLRNSWADGTESCLFFPESKQPVFPFEGRCHVNVKTLFKIAFPCWVIRVGFPLNFDVPDDRHVCCAEQVAWVFLHRAEEDPVVSLDGREVFLRLPGLGFSSVPSVYPSPDGLIDHCINRTEGFVADDMPVVVGSTANQRVEFLYQFP